jgi:hypothetical protein
MAGRDDGESGGQPVCESPLQYDPPRVELVVTAAELEREILYAGVYQ